MGIVESMEKEGRRQNIAKVGDEICVKITGIEDVGYGEGFRESDKLISEYSTKSFDFMKTTLEKSDFSKDEIALLHALKKYFRL